MKGTHSVPVVETLGWLITVWNLSPLVEMTNNATILDGRSRYHERSYVIYFFVIKCYRFLICFFENDTHVVLMTISGPLKWQFLDSKNFYYGIKFCVFHKTRNRLFSSKSNVFNCSSMHSFMKKFYETFQISRQIS